MSVPVEIGTPKSADWRMAYMRLCGQLRRQREARGMTQEELAASLGRGVATVGRWESGRGAPSAMDLFHWASLVGVDIRSNMIDGGGAAVAQGGAR